MTEPRVICVGEINFQAESFVNDDPTSHSLFEFANNFLVWLYQLPLLPLISQNTPPQTLGPPNTCAQAFELDNLAVINKHVDFGPVILDVPGKDLRVGGLE